MVEFFFFLLRSTKSVGERERISWRGRERSTKSVGERETERESERPLNLYNYFFVGLKLALAKWAQIGLKVERAVGCRTKRNTCFRWCRPNRPFALSNRKRPVAPSLRKQKGKWALDSSTTKPVFGESGI